MKCRIKPVVSILLAHAFFGCAKHSGGGSNPSSLTVFNELATSDGIRRLL